MKILRPEVTEDLKKTTNSLFSLFDSTILQLFNITDNEYDELLNNLSDEQLNTFLDSIGNMEKKSTFSEIRQGLELRNKYVSYYANTTK